MCDHWGSAIKCMWAPQLKYLVGIATKCATSSHNNSNNKMQGRSDLKTEKIRMEPERWHKL